MKKAISLVLAAVLALCMAGGAAADSIHLRYAELDVGENLLTVDAHYFADRVNELSGGRIIIDIYDSAQLGPEKEAVQGTQMGAIDICRATVTLLADFDMPMLNLISSSAGNTAGRCWTVTSATCCALIRRRRRPEWSACGLLRRAPAASSPWTDRLHGLTRLQAGRSARTTQAS